ncbi:MAG: glycolate oxidase subunit GlcF [Proteobacteria bacterium]|nr:glycolate oxidase subunit GlcF [Pseudomonadota bacterium]
MQTNLGDQFKQTTNARVVEEILRKCVHCGFCNATCPTYQLLGDELDGPRGRIYQMKQFFEGEPANAEILKHLDRCLTCRSCETTCPSGVKYSTLLEIGREAIERELPRPAIERIKRRGITWFLNSGWIFNLTLQVARFFSRVLPASLRRSIPAQQEPIAAVQNHHQRRVLMLSGCVQPSLAPNTNAAAARLLDRFGISAIEIKAKHCCGGVGLHTSQIEQGRGQARRLIDLWWPQVEAGIEAIVFTASGCGVTLKDYPELFALEPEYAAKAKTIAELSQDLSELVAAEIEKHPLKIGQPRRVAFHTPCTLQHGLGLKDKVESLLAKAGYHLCEVADAHLCCGSAGTYSLLQPELSARLRNDKQNALMIDRPELIATANIGCQMHIANGASVPVVHWVELLNDALQTGG